MSPRLLGPSCAGLVLCLFAHAGHAECVPSEGAERFKLRSEFPLRGTAGHLAVLTVTIEHGRGETLLARGAKLEPGSEQAKSLQSAGFGLPAAAIAQGVGTDESSGAHGAPTVRRQEQGDSVQSTLTLPLVLLPSEPGTVQAKLPPLPLSVVQASGQVLTACTPSHDLEIVDPTASVPEAAPRDRFAPQRQREHWQALEYALWALGAALCLLALGAYGYRVWSRRPKPTPPPPPPRPAWEVALEQLAAIRARLPESPAERSLQEITASLRQYLGRVCGFDGLESTTEEVLEALRQRALPLEVLEQVTPLLREADLVKFAAQPCELAHAERALEQVLALVERLRPTATTPAAEPAPQEFDG